ncbi:hypothetical protein [Amphiplicatus metriothermophilus]|uniref:Lipoprotein n=1 Tax=Amphiplicatus metriothermophilus TaxID=1519374 RepID=A0A239PKI7_9PROT|nr:hypothetical protein [Amphiplicatus metriothermophilus]MBB5517348.1 hypothetical protein [Amphiplicatus metriothermophilus]SNT68316.1 hypothetical protein SAMN06297382_0818 [Amphiplicatus metriothermophilus]
MRYRALVLIAPVLLLAACGGGGDREKAAFVAACVAEGDSEAFCVCQGDALRAELDEETFASLVEFAESMAGASEDAKGMIAMGALSNPKLIAALDKVEATAKTCKQAAALEEARAEVAVLEAARNARRKQAAARKCPHRPVMSPRLPGAPVDDVADLRLGMSFEDVEAILECRGDVLNFDVAREWARDSHGVETRQLLRAADGEICPAEARVAGGQGCDDGGYAFEPLQNVNQEFVVAFAGLPGAERAGVIWRRTVFSESEYPTVSSLQEALVEKYGRPNASANQEGYYSLGHRPGSVTYSWVYDPMGALIPSSDSARLSRCVNGPRPTFQGRMSWNGACGLTIRAEIMPAVGNAILARELNVVVMDQKRFDDAVKQFDIDLRTAVEAQHKGKGAAPDL